MRDDLKVGLLVSDTTSVGGAGGGTGAQIAHTAQQTAGQGAAVVTQQTSEVTETVKQQAATVTQEAATQARQLAAGLRERLGGETRAQGERLVRNLRGLADELQRMGGHGRPDSVATTVVRGLAEGGHQAADHLEQRGPGGLLDEVQDFARRRPGLFLAGAALAGFAVGRTGKDVATAPSDHHSGAGTGTAAQPGLENEARPTAPLPAVGAVDEPSAGPRHYGQPQSTPPAAPLSGTSGPPLPSPDVPSQWPQPDSGR